MTRGYALQDTVFRDRGFKVDTGSDAEMGFDMRLLKSQKHQYCSSGYKMVEKRGWGGGGRLQGKEHLRFWRTCLKRRNGCSRIHHWRYRHNHCSDEQR